MCEEVTVVRVPMPREVADLGVTAYACRCGDVTVTVYADPALTSDEVAAAVARLARQVDRERRRPVDPPRA